MTLSELISCFNGVKRNNNGSYQCKCPVHNDKKASMTISVKNDKLLLHCHAGCKTEDILAAVGLSMSDLCEEKTQQSQDWKSRLEKSQKKKIEAIYDYYDSEKKYLYSKVRFSGKEIRYVTVDKVNDRYEYGKPTGAETLYNLPELRKAVRNGIPVFITEGEKDVETLKAMGYVATTAGSVTDWKKEYAAYFTGAKVVILPDNDEPGLKLKDRIIRDLRHYAHSVRWAITSVTDKGDVTDYLKKERHTKENLQQLIGQTSNINAPWIYLVGKGENQKLKINAGILADSISKGLSYKIVRRPDEEKDDFYFYEHGVYNKCNRNKVKSIIMRYIPKEFVSDNLINNVYNLLMCQEANICTYRDLDREENYINLRNGLYNIKTKKLERHRPDVLSTIQLECEYDPNAIHRPVFERYINDLCSDRDGNIDEEKKAIVQEYAGIILSSVRVHRTKVALVLYSLLGNTGKTQLLNLLSELLGGDKTANIPIQNMNEASKFALGEIVGKRMISIGDQTSSEIKDSAVFKQLTGGDEVKVEQKGKQPYSYRFPGGIIIACNNLPTFSDDKGGHLFQRLCVIPCINVIEEGRRDSMLLDKMLEERNAIFNWFLAGLHRLIDNGYKLTKSKACEMAMNEYRTKMDTVYRYLSETHIITGDKNDMVSKPGFEDDYMQWCKDNGFLNVNKQNIKDRMEANGCPADKANYNGSRGVMVYRNLKEKPSSFEEIEEQTEIPF